MLENIQADSWGSIPPLRIPSLLPHDLCHEWNASPAPGTLRFILIYRVVCVSWQFPNLAGNGNLNYFLSFLSQPRASDESSTQASTHSSATSNGATVCRRLPCCCSPAARSDGPDGNHCCWCGCGFCRRPHSGSRHHWGLQWRKQCWTLKAWHHLPGKTWGSIPFGGVFYERI